jgi:hypothetical protein
MSGKAMPGQQAFLRKAALAGASRRKSDRARAREARRRENNDTLHDRMVRSLERSRRSSRRPRRRRHVSDARPGSGSLRSDIVALVASVDAQDPASSDAVSARKPAFCPASAVIRRPAGSPGRLPAGRDPDVLEKLLRQDRFSRRVDARNRARLLEAPQRKQLPPNKNVSPMTAKPFCPHTRPLRRDGVPLDSLPAADADRAVAEGHVLALRSGRATDARLPSPERRARFPMETEWRLINEHRNAQRLADGRRAEAEFRDGARAMKLRLDAQVAEQRRRAAAAAEERERDARVVRRRATEFREEQRAARRREVAAQAERRRQLGDMLRAKAERSAAERQASIAQGLEEAKRAARHLREETEAEAEAKREQRRRNERTKRENREREELKRRQFLRIVEEDRKRDAEYAAKLEREDAARAAALATTYATQEKRMNLQLFATADVREQARLDQERALREQAAKARADERAERAREAKRKAFEAECRRANDARLEEMEARRWAEFHDGAKVLARNKAVADEAHAALDARRQKRKADAVAHAAAVRRQARADRRARARVEMSRLDKRLHRDHLAEALRWEARRRQAKHGPQRAGGGV